MNKFVLRQSLLLLLTATIWGVAFVAQSVGMDYVGPFTFNAVRNLIGAVVLLPCIAFLKKQDGKETQKASDKTLLIGGVSCGVILFIASSFQQFGIKYTTVGKAGFITAMYIVLVPLLGLFFHKKVVATCEQFDTIGKEGKITYEVVNMLKIDMDNISTVAANKAHVCNEHLPIFFMRAIMAGFFIVVAVLLSNVTAGHPHAIPSIIV